MFYTGAEKPVFFVASRGHHADIGGITPGSMPPHSSSIHEEGAVFKSFKIVQEGHFNEEGITQDKTRQDKTRQDKTRQDKTRQDKTRQDKTRQDKTRQDKTDKTILFS